MDGSCHLVSDYELSSYIDVPMHILFHGVAKETFLLITRWSKAHMLNESAKRCFSLVLEDIAKLKLDFIDVQPFSPSFGGWLNYNFSALARIANAFYHGFKIMKMDKQYEAPKKPQKYWIRKENEAWLRAHGKYEAHFKKKDHHFIDAEVKRLMSMD